jgi:hypothetical protein
MVTIPPRPSDATGQARQAPDYGPRVALALSIIQHRAWCPRCRPHAEQARYALLGASIQELADGVADA